MPTPDEALQFAIMVRSGMPAEQAVQYFIPEDDPDPIGSAKALTPKWLRSKVVKDAFLKVQGKPWQTMSPDEKIREALGIHYDQLAFFLYSHNYSLLAGADKQKADTCRQALEAKLAGMAGKMDVMSKFLDDVFTGKVQLAKPASPAGTLVPSPPTTPVKKVVES